MLYLSPFTKQFKVLLNPGANLPQADITCDPYLLSTSDILEGAHGVIKIEKSSGTSRNSPSGVHLTSQINIHLQSKSLSFKFTGLGSQGRKDCFSAQRPRVIFKSWETGKTVGYLKFLPAVWSVFSQEEAD